MTSTATTRPRNGSPCAAAPHAAGTTTPGPQARPAEAAGIRAAEVQVTLVGENVGHALNAFLTTDKGLVYVDDTEAPDKIARIETYQTYRSVTLVGFNTAYLRNDAWWNGLTGNYYYVADSYGGQAVVEHQWIYW